MKKILLILLNLLFVTNVYAANSDLSIDSANIWITPESPVSSFATTIYARVKNSGSSDSIGTVTFTSKSTGVKISTDQPVSVLPNGTDDVFISWTAPYGKQDIVVTIIPWDSSDNSSNNTASIAFFVDADPDKDKVGNQQDSDDDNDKCPDIEDLFPLDASECKDSDGDGEGDTKDKDADNDGCEDEQDDFQTDPTECKDTDKDGIGNNKDTDDDADGIEDEAELTLATNPEKSDTDDDGSDDKTDLFPLDKNEKEDSDGDSVGNNTDDDDDNDNILDNEDEFPYNPAPIISFKNKELSASINEEILFDASASYDPKKENISFVWEIDGQEFTQPKITYAFTKTGEYDGSIKVTDEQGQEREFNFKINIKDYTVTYWIIFLIIIILATLISLKYISKAKNKVDHKLKK